MADRVLYLLSSDPPPSAYTRVDIVGGGFHWFNLLVFVGRNCACVASDDPGRRQISKGEKENDSANSAIISTVLMLIIYSVLQV